MNAREQGFLLLTSHLGDPQRKVLTVAQLRNLSLRVRARQKPVADGQLSVTDIMHLGYEQETAQRIVTLLSQQEQLEWYLKKGARSGCFPISRISEGYPAALRNQLGLDCPGVLWAKGNLAFLEKPAISLVGSRVLKKENRIFAEEVGRQAARQGYVLISGNANGADQTAQKACLQAGGEVISIVADTLEEHSLDERILYLSEDGFDLSFSPLRALSRNRLIHAMGRMTFVAQCTYEKGGTWDGTKNNLRRGYGPVFCFQDNSQAVSALTNMGAMPILMESLADFSMLQPERSSFLETV